MGTELVCSRLTASTMTSTPQGRAAAPSSICTCRPAPDPAQIPARTPDTSAQSATAADQLRNWCRTQSTRRSVVTTPVWRRNDCPSRRMGIVFGNTGDSKSRRHYRPLNSVHRHHLEAAASSRATSSTSAAMPLQGACDGLRVHEHRLRGEDRGVEVIVPGDSEPRKRGTARDTAGTSQLSAADSAAGGALQELAHRRSAPVSGGGSLGTSGVAAGEDQRLLGDDPVASTGGRSSHIPGSSLYLFSSDPSLWPSPPSHQGPTSLITSPRPVAGPLTT